MRPRPRVSQHDETGVVEKLVDERHPHHQFGAARDPRSYRDPLTIDPMVASDEPYGGETIEGLLVVGRAILTSWETRSFEQIHRSSNVAFGEAHLPMTSGRIRTLS